MRNVQLKENIEKVTYWQDRIKSYEQKTQDINKQCFEKEELMLKLMSGEKKMPWRSLIDDKRRDLFLEITHTYNFHFCEFKIISQLML